MDSDHEWTHYQHIVFLEDEKVYYVYYGWHFKGSTLEDMKGLIHETESW